MSVCTTTAFLMFKLLVENMVLPRWVVKMQWDVWSPLLCISACTEPFSHFYICSSFIYFVSVWFQHSLMLHYDQCYQIHFFKPINSYWSFCLSSCLLCTESVLYLCTFLADLICCFLFCVCVVLLCLAVQNVWRIHHLHLLLFSLLLVLSCAET